MEANSSSFLELSKDYSRLRSMHQLNETSFKKDTTYAISSGDDQKSIIYQFKIDTIQKLEEDSNLPDLLSSYTNACSEYAKFLKEKLSQINSNRNKDVYVRCMREYEEIENEKHLWQLLQRLFIDQQKEEGCIQDELEDQILYSDKNENNGSDLDELMLNERALIERLEKSYPLLRRIRIVINWLESIARESDYYKSIRESMNGFSEKCANWEHTLHYLKSAKSVGQKEKNLLSGREFVTELDPDAPIRQQKSLFDLDQEDEFKIMEYLFAFIRAGDLETAREFCFKIGQPWRAATLEGFKLFQDNNYSIVDHPFESKGREKQVFKNEGNINRDIWRLMVYKLIKDEHFSPYEKAVYASLAGFVSPVLSVCKNYMDFIWAYFKGFYNKIIERELRQKITVRDYVNIPYDPEEDHLFLGSNTTEHSNLPTINQIFDRIRVLVMNSNANGLSGSLSIATSSLASDSAVISSRINSVKSDLQKPFSIILKHVICSGLEGFKSGTIELMDYLNVALNEEKNNGFLIRFSAHLSLFYRSASILLKDDTFIQIIDAYSQYLIQNDYKEIIAYYLSQLPSEIQIQRYSNYLKTIDDNKDRLLLLKLAEERNMNIQAITLKIVDSLSKKSNAPLNISKKELGVPDATQNRLIKSVEDLFISNKSNQNLSDEDRTKINAIDWILYDSSQRLKLLEYANLSMRYFLLERKSFDAARQVFSKIPNDTISGILSQYNFISQNNVTINSSAIDSNFNLVIENLPLKVSNSIKEYLCFKEYIDAIKLYNEWFEYFYKEKPQKPTNLINQSQLSQDQTISSHEKTFAERMTQNYQLKQYDDLTARWFSKALLYCEKVRAKFFAVLKFPYGGWMCDLQPNDDFSDDDDYAQSSDEERMLDDDAYGKELNLKGTAKRQQELSALRKLYLPNICFVMLDMLAKMNLNKELIKITDLVATKTYKLYELFDEEQLKCFANKIAESSISLVDSNFDYLGYN